MNAHLAPRQGKQAHQVRHQVIIANERRNRISFAITQVLDSHRLHRHPLIDGSCQQSTVEGTQLAAIGGGAFREDQQRPGVAQLLADLLSQTLAVATAATDEQRAGFIRQPAGYWPVAYFGLGQKRQRKQHAEQGYVGPGNMVADPQHRQLWPLAKHPNLEGQGGDQAFHEQAGPALTALGRGLQAQAFTQGNHAGHQHAQ
ncbi:hypothetical protein D3C81_1303620 [compost metagenome]